MALVAAVVASGIVASASAATITWSGGTSTDFEVGGNWVGGVVPANSATTDTAAFTGTPTANAPQITTSRSVLGVQFGSTAGWSLTSSATSNVLTLGSSGIQAANTTGTDTVAVNLGVLGGTSLTNTVIGVGGSTVASGNLLLTGSLSGGASGSPLLAAVVVGSSTRKDVVTISPSTGNSVNLYTTGASGQAALGTGLGGTLALGGVGANATSSINTLSNSASAGLRYQAGATLQVNSGTWLTNDVGSNNSNTAAGTLQITGGTLATGGARYLVNAGGVATMTGGTLKVTGAGFLNSSGGGFGIGSQGTGTASFTISGGAIDSAKATSGTNFVGGTATGLFNQTGGTVTTGITAATNVFTGASAAATGSSANLTIGVVTSGVSGAYTLTGGTLTVGGTIAGAAATGGGVSNFNFGGGTLAARTFDATNLGSNAAATASANQIAASTNVGTLENYGGTVAPGGVGSAGLMAVTGGYAGNGNGSTLSFDLGGTAAAAAFAGAAGSYDDVTVSGSTALNDVLAVNLIGGFTPANSDTFTILNSTGTLSGAFSNVAFGGTINAGAGTFNVNQVGNTVVLSNFNAIAVPEPTVLGLAGAGAITLAFRRRRAAVR